MANVSKSVADAIARTNVFNLLGMDGFKPISNQSYGIVVKDGNDISRLVEVKAIVRQIDEELDGNELLEFEVEEYQTHLKEKEAKRQEAEAKKAQKIAKDKKRREEKKGA